MAPRTLCTRATRTGSCAQPGTGRQHAGQRRRLTAYLAIPTAFIKIVSPRAEGVPPLLRTAPLFRPGVLGLALNVGATAGASEDGFPAAPVRSAVAILCRRRQRSGRRMLVAER